MDEVDSGWHRRNVVLILATEKGQHTHTHTHSFTLNTAEFWCVDNIVSNPIIDL